MVSAIPEIVVIALLLSSFLCRQFSVYKTVFLFFCSFIVVKCSWLWPPCIADAGVIFLSCFFFRLSLFSSPNFSGHRLDV